MKPALILLLILIVSGAVLYLLDRRGKHADNTAAVDDDSSADNADATRCTDETCVVHDTCPSQLILTQACNSKVLYYEDEELDRFAGRAADEYSEAEIEEFRDVLYTLQHSDLLSWQHSIARRGITLPTPIHDELLSLLTTPSSS